jgi:hypothetical protein
LRNYHFRFISDRQVVELFNLARFFVLVVRFDCSVLPIVHFVAGLSVSGAVVVVLVVPVGFAVSGAIVVVLIVLVGFAVVCVLFLFRLLFVGVT